MNLFNFTSITARRMHIEAYFDSINLSIDAARRPVVFYIALLILILVADVTSWNFIVSGACCLRSSEVSTNLMEESL